MILWLKDMYILYSKQQRFISRQFLCVSLFIFQHRFPSLVKGDAFKMRCFVLRGFKSRPVHSGAFAHDNYNYNICNY